MTWGASGGKDLETWTQQVQLLSQCSSEGQGHCQQPYGNLQNFLIALARGHHKSHLQTFHCLQSPLQTECLTIALGQEELPLLSLLQMSKLRLRSPVICSSLCSEWEGKLELHSKSTNFKANLLPPAPSSPLSWTNDYPEFSLMSVSWCPLRDLL